MNDETDIFCALLGVAAGLALATLLLWLSRGG